jgi:hypothetical protein
MKDDSNSTAPERSRVAHLRGLFSWRQIRRVLIVTAWTATGVALLYAVENWRGRRAWDAYRKALEARGGQLDLRAFIPKPVPEKQNFAATPWIESWFVRSNFQAGWTDNFARAESMVRDLGPANKSRRDLTDLGAWASALKAVESGVTNPTPQTAVDKTSGRSEAALTVVKALADIEPQLAALRAAAARSEARYPIFFDMENPWGILLPHLPRIRGVCQRLQLKACAELAAGHPEKALADIQLMLRFVESAKDQPFLVSHAAGLAWFHSATQPIWEGLAEHRWSDEQLIALQRMLAAIDFMATLDHGCKAERAAGILTADLLYRGKYRMHHLAPSEFGGEFANMVGAFAPHGWFELEKLAYCKLFEAHMSGGFDSSTKRVFPGRILSNTRQVEEQLGGAGRGFTRVLKHQVLSALLLPALSAVTLKTSVAQTAANHAVLACALERHRLANGKFPVTLQALAPQFIAQLPHDLITGEAYKYSRTGEEHYMLYSVGWNERDDGGVGKTSSEETGGDWVWEIAATAR